MDESLLTNILVILLLLAGSSGFFGKNLPKIIWWISLVSAGLSGFVIGMMVAPFPDSMIIGAFASTGVILLIVFLRIPRKNQPR